MKIRPDPRAVIFGCKGYKLSDEEQFFFSETNPCGFILFSRNCKNIEQIKQLVKSLRSSVNRKDVPILIDQEGGRVTRLNGREWRTPPSQGSFGELANLLSDKDINRLLWLNGALIGHELISLGINVNCAPVLDLRIKGQSEVIGDRSYGDQPELITKLAKSFISGMQSVGVYAVIKHIPGHGRAKIDSHVDLPVVDETMENLLSNDFLPFINLNYCYFAMTAHVMFSAIDNQHPVTFSSKVINEIIRKKIGFKGLLLSDDISMGALSGSVMERSSMAINAGCDLVLHCNGNIDEMKEVIKAVPHIKKHKLQNPADFSIKQNNPFNYNNLYQEFNRLYQLGNTCD